MDTEENLNVEEQAFIDETPNTRKKTLLIIAALLGVVVLAGAAFWGARLLNQPAQGMDPFAMAMPGKGGGPGVVKRELSANIKHAAEVPERRPDIGGVVLEIGDNAVTVGTNAEITASKSENGKVSPKVEVNGPTAEIVFTSDTKIYLDTTFENRGPENMPAEDEVIQQTVKEADMEMIEKDGHLSVWGQKRGDRYIAEVVLISKPVIFTRGPVE